MISLEKNYDFINIGFFILKKYIANISSSKNCKFENQVLNKLIKNKKFLHI